MRSLIATTLVEILRSNLLLTRKEKAKLGIVVLLQMSLAALDLIGVALFGVLGAIAANGLSSTGPGNRVSRILSILHLSGFEIRYQVMILASVACVLLIMKTLISLVFNRRAIFFLSRRAALVSSRMIRKFLTQPITSIQQKSMHETVYSVTSGVSTLTTGILGAALSTFTDFFLLLLVGLGLFLVDPITAVTIIIFYSSVAYALYYFMHKRAEKLGRLSSELSIKSNEIIYEILVAFREAVVRNRRAYYAKVIGDRRIALANTSAEFAFLPSISKYVLEISLVLSALVMGAIQFSMNSAGRAVGTLVLFLAGSYRIAPAILRIQQSIVSIRTNIGIAEPTLDMIRSLSSFTEEDVANSKFDFSHSGFSGDILLSDVSFKYPTSPKQTLANVNLNIRNGQFVAFVGPSGAGKSTLADLCLGVLNPDTGKVQLSGLKPSDALSKWPGVVGYVPQDVVIFNNSIKMNVCMGFPAYEIDEFFLEKALNLAQLETFVRELPKDVESEVGDRGTKLSGGQRQRLGIARALYTNPRLLVLDEATSSLDGATEASITQELLKLKGEVTLIVIAHRLSTVQAADMVVYIDNGAIIACGSFEDVRSKVPDFDKQATLMGLIEADE